MTAIVFDVDGVLVSTDALHEHAWRRMAREFGVPFADDLPPKLRGVSRTESLRRLLGDRHRGFSESTQAEMLVRKNELFLAAVDALSPSDAMPNAREILSELRRRGVPVAAASSSRNARRVLWQVELAPLIDAVVDGNDVASAKPAPDAFAQAALRLGIDPGECLAVEDADAGVASARAAGLRVFAVGAAAGDERAAASAASLAEIDADRLLAAATA
ncbi:MAG: beta-phosphoglucomutase family hydrolase [Planctomycetota bacterium]